MLEYCEYYELTVNSNGSFVDINNSNDVFMKKNDLGLTQITKSYTFGWKECIPSLQVLDDSIYYSVCEAETQQYKIYWLSINASANSKIASVFAKTETLITENGMVDYRLGFYMKPGSRLRIVMSEKGQTLYIRNFVFIIEPSDTTSSKFLTVGGDGSSNVSANIVFEDCVFIIKHTSESGGYDTNNKGYVNIVGSEYVSFINCVFILETNDTNKVIILRLGENIKNIVGCSYFNTNDYKNIRFCFGDFNGFINYASTICFNYFFNVPLEPASSSVNVTNVERMLIRNNIFLCYQGDGENIFYLNSTGRVVFVDNVFHLLPMSGNDMGYIYTYDENAETISHVFFYNNYIYAPVGRDYTSKIQEEFIKYFVYNHIEYDNENLVNKGIILYDITLEEGETIISGLLDVFSNVPSLYHDIIGSLPEVSRADSYKVDDLVITNSVAVVDKAPEDYYPSEEDVRQGVSYDSGNRIGKMIVPPEHLVRVSVVYDNFRKYGRFNINEYKRNINFSKPEVT